MNTYIKSDAFNGLTQFNGLRVTDVKDKETGNQEIGASGNTKGYHIGPGRMVYLADSQVETR